jgi:hypothetical protein
MIDKIEAMIERGTYFRGELDGLRRASPWDTLSPALRPSKYYKAVADLRPFGFDAMLHIDQKRYGTHKVELFETGKKGMTELLSTIERIVDCDPGGCRLGRVDLAADVRDVPLSWFREHSYVQYKQFICAHWKHVEEENSEMGKKVYQMLYFGKRPSCIRVYDKTAERVAHYQLWKRRQVRAAKRDWLADTAQQDPSKRGPLVLPEFPTVAEWLAHELPQLNIDVVLPPQSDVARFPVLTRVENQFGGRVPEPLQTVSDMRKNVLDFNPFARMKILGGHVIPPSLYDRDPGENYRFTVSQWFFYMGVRASWAINGAQSTRNMLNRDRNGAKYLERMREFLPASELDDCPGISESDLYERYRNSISRQLAA